MACLYFSAWLLKLHDKIKWLIFTMPFYILMAAKLELNKILTDSLFTFTNFFVKKQHSQPESTSCVPLSSEHKHFLNGWPYQLPQRGDEQKHFPRRPAESHTRPASLSVQRPLCLPLPFPWQQPGAPSRDGYLQQVYFQICTQVSLWSVHMVTLFLAFAKYWVAQYMHTFSWLHQCLPSFRTRWFLDWHSFLSLRSWTLKQRAAGAEMVLSVRDANWWITNIKSRVPMVRENLEISGSDFHACKSHGDLLHLILFL